MDGDFKKNNKVKNIINGKVVPLVLAGSILFSSGTPAKQAKAFNFEEPTISSEELNSYEYQQLYLGGRLVEFTKETGAPYKKSSKLMVPIKAIADAYHATYQYDSKKKTVTMSRFGESITWTVGSKKATYKDANGKKTSITLKVKTTSKGGVIYATAASFNKIFSIRTAKDENKTVHFELANNFENLDFKEKKILTMKQLAKKTKEFKYIMFDGVKMPKSYIEVLKKSSQYFCYIKGDEAVVISYDLAKALNYYFGLEKEFKSGLYNATTDKEVSVMLKNAYRSDDISLDEVYFFQEIAHILSGEFVTKETIYESNNVKVTYDRNKLSPYGAKEHTKVMKKVNDIIVKVNKDAENDPELSGDLMMVANLVDKVGRAAKAGLGTSASEWEKGTCQCSGYSNALEMAVRAMGYLCVSIDGYYNGAQHRLNAVYIPSEKAWYGADATFGIIFPIEDMKAEGYTLDERVYKDDNGIVTYSGVETNIDREILMDTYKYTYYLDKKDN